MKKAIIANILMLCVWASVSALPKDRKADVNMAPPAADPVTDYWDDFWDNAQLSQKSAEGIYMDAILLQYEGKYKDALKKFKFLIDSGVDDSYVYLNMFSAYTNLLAKKADKVMAEEALRYVLKAVAKHPDVVELYSLWIEMSRAIGDEKQFLKAAGALLEKYPDNRKANYYIGAYYYMNGQMEKAQPYLEKVIVAPNEGGNFDYLSQYYSLFYLGMISFRNYNYNNAIRFLEKAGEIYAEDMELVRYLALLHAVVLDFDQSIAYVDKLPKSYWQSEMIDLVAAVRFAAQSADLPNILKAYPQKTHFVESINYYYAGKYADSIQAIQKYMKKNNSDDYYSHFVLYKNYEALSDHQSLWREAFILGKKAGEAQKSGLAISYYKMIENNTNLVPDVYWFIGSLLDDSGKYQEAAEYYQKYLSYPGAKEYRAISQIRLSFMYYQMKDISKAFAQIDIAKKNAKTKTEKYQVFFYSGMLNLEFDKKTDALKDFENALDIDKSDHRIYYYIGAVLVGMERIDEALKYLLIGRKANPESSEMNNLLAYTYALKGENLDEALKLVNLALITSPDSLAYLDTLGWIYFRMGEIDKAYNVFHQLELRLGELPKAPGMEDIYYHLGIIYENKGKLDTAIDYYKQGLKLNPVNTQLSEKKKLWEK
jgi:tetratricopeptide (TPR) repeat protein